MNAPVHSVKMLFQHGKILVSIVRMTYIIHRY